MTIPSTLQIERTDIRYLLSLIKSEVKREINCHSIGAIQSFDPATLTATVVFNYRKVLKKRNAVSPSSNNYTDVIIDYPMLVRVPVIVLNGGGAYTTYPIAKGDTCLLMFCDRDIDLWLELGNTQSPPNTERMHDLSDAVALVGVYPVTNPIPSYSIDSIMTVFGQTIMKLTNVFASLIDTTGQRLCQSGFGQAYFGTVLPSGWLWCDGSLVSKTTYPYLFAAIGYTYGGSGNNFRLPDMRGRVPVGLDNMGGSDANRLLQTQNSFTQNRKTLGGSVGEAAHVQTINELVGHTHTFTAAINPATGAGGAGNSAGNTLLTTDSTGGGQPANVVQPGLMCNWIIKI